MRLLIYIIILIPVTGLLRSADAQSQINDGGPEREENLFFALIRANHKESYITFSQGLGNLEPLVFESLIAPYFLLRTSSDGRWGATISPEIVLRMQASYSFPVRTPGYLPGVTFYHLLTQQTKKQGRPAYMYLSLVHHSNGQEGDLYLEDGSINYKTGNFSTNFFEFGVFFNNILAPFDDVTDYFRTSFEIHPDIGRSEGLNRKYSFVRWHNSIRLIKSPYQTYGGPKIQTTFHSTWLFGSLNNAAVTDIKERLNVSITFSIKPKVLKDVGLFANFYTGKDYYNIYFDRRITTFRIGIHAYSFK